MVVRYFHFMNLDGEGDGFICRYSGSDALSRAMWDGGYPDTLLEHLSPTWIVPGTIDYLAD